MDYKEIFNYWKTSEVFSKAHRDELAKLTDEKEIEDRFYKDLAFGTGGMRGVMGIGPNRYNVYNVRKASQAFAKVLAKEPKAKEMGVAVAYDPRNGSKEFAKETALVFAANGFKTYLYSFVSATPLLSFTVRDLKCVGGVVITASHNTKEYNGYKAYDKTGCQLLPADAELVMAEFAKTRLEDIPSITEEDAIQKGLLFYIGEDERAAFENAVLACSGNVDAKAKANLKIVYTPVFGAGSFPVRHVLSKAGFNDVFFVEQQAGPDGNFPGLKSPNPENKETLQLGIDIATQIGADLVIGTDPDSDRVGFAARKGDKLDCLSGNQVAALLLDYLIRTKKVKENSAIVTTIVSGCLGTDIAKKNGLKVKEVLTGFKYIGDQMTKFKENGTDFFFGYEESYGYLVGDHARDKDGMVGALLAAEAAALLKSEGKTLWDRLEELYKIYGYHMDKLDSYTLPGKDGAEKIENSCAKLRKEGKNLFADGKLLDYLDGIDDIPKDNVLKFIFNDGSWLAVRPSGTEPKIKIYFSIVADHAENAMVSYMKKKQVLEQFMELN